MILIPIVTVCIPCRCTKFAPTVPVKLLRNTNSLYCLDKKNLEIIFFLDFRKGVKMAAFSDVEHPWSWLHREEIKCSSCPAQVNPFNVWYRHPVLKTIQCSECYKFYNQGRSKVFVHDFLVILNPEICPNLPNFLEVNLQKMKMVITCIADCVAKEDRYMVATIASNLFVSNAF